MQAHRFDPTRMLLVSALLAVLFIGCSESGDPPQTVQQAAATVAGGDVSSAQEESAPAPNTSLTSNTLQLPDVGEFKPLAEECCTQPGDASECWLGDAEMDGALCGNDGDCISGSCNLAQGRCRCSSDDDCNDGVCKNELCGPSWCNGYQVCSCWGGCEWWSNDEDMTLHDLAATQGLYCCEGVYAEGPIEVDPALGGHFSQTPCGGCATDGDCDDNNPCTTDQCVDEACAYTNLTGTVDDIPDAAECPFNNDTFSSECARPRCNSGNCTYELGYNEGNPCTVGPDLPPDDAHTDCYTALCGNAGTCEITVLEDGPCDVGINDCSDARCDASAMCIDGPLDDPSTNDACCDPAKAPSFDDGFPCTDDYCCYEGHGAATCDGAVPYMDRNVPNYNGTGNCCMDSNHCFDSNNCTRNICCNEVNSADPACSDANWECSQTLEDVPGCCDDSPANMADNCNDAYTCTNNICCTPAAIAAAGPGDPCDGVSANNCADVTAFSPVTAGCCDPDGAGAADCDDGNACTIDDCDPLTMRCDSTPEPSFAGCCGPNPSQACTDDGNACTVEVCCDEAKIAAAGAGDPCDGADAWNCGVGIATTPGCCADASDCDDGNPCTEDTCVNNQCQVNEWADVSAHPGCCNVAAWDGSPQCADSPDAGDCTQNTCCDAGMVASATSADDPCYGRKAWQCDNPAPATPDPGCCNQTTAATDCNPLGNGCVAVSCSTTHNCAWTPYPAGGANCCADSVDCPGPGAARPCLDSASCDVTGDPMADAAYAVCQYVYKAAGTICGADEECYSQVCADPIDANWNCPAIQYVPARPDGSAATCTGTTVQCGQYWCDGAGGCSDKETFENNHGNDDCASATGLGGNAVINASGTNECGTITYEPDATGRFAKCGGVTQADVVYNYDDIVDDDYELTHRVVTVADTTGGRVPVIYTRGTCGDSTTQESCDARCEWDGSNYNASDYGVAVAGVCGAAGEVIVITGPHAVEDMPNHDTNNLPTVASQDFDDNDVRDGYDQSRDFSTSLVVDSKASNPSYGFEFDITIEEEPHNNNDCRQIASYSAPPIIDGNFQWKQRWRGTMTDGSAGTHLYDNYFGASGPQMEYSGTVDAANPHQAFFKVNLPSSSGEYLVYVDWYGAENYSESGMPSHGDTATVGASFINATISHLGQDSADPNACSNVAGDIESAADPDGYPAQLILNTDDAGWEDSFLAISNYLPDDYGDYELNLVRPQQKFFGFSTAYSTEASNRCGTLDYFDAENVRLDLIPSGGVEAGYLVTVTDLDGIASPHDTSTCDWHTKRGYNIGDVPWLVSPDCHESDALNFARWEGRNEAAIWATLPFKFPMAGKFYDKVYFDSTGRVEPRETFGKCGSDGDCAAYTECGDADAGCVCVSEFGGQCAYDPGGYIYNPTTKDMFAPYSAGGHAPVLSPAWGSFEMDWDGMSDVGEPDEWGYITAQTVAFEGTTAYVISWVGMDIHYLRITEGLFGYTLTKLPSRSSYSWFSRSYSLNGWADYRNSLNWQLVIRADGRAVFYYAPSLDEEVWDEGVDRGAWSIIVTGGIQPEDPTSPPDLIEGSCADAADCTEFGTGAQCDNSDDDRSAFWCYRRVDPLVRDADDGTLLPGIGNE